MIRRTLGMLAMGLMALMAVGCCPMTKLNVSIELDKSFQDKYGKDRTVEVDVVGVYPNMRERWFKYPMTKYWESGDTMRTSAKDLRRTLTFKGGDLTPQVIKSDDPIWGQWLAGGADKEPSEIYVLVQLPKIFSAADDKDGSEDPRRQILTTKGCRYQSSGLGGVPTVRLVIDADRISSVTTLKP
jgi:hypothetical protein